MSKGKKVKQLQTTVLRSSKGRKVSDGDILLVNYYGTLLSTGESFDGNFNFTSFEPPVSNYFSSNGSLIRGGVNSTPYELILGSAGIDDGLGLKTVWVRWWTPISRQPGLRRSCPSGYSRQ